MIVPNSLRSHLPKGTRPASKSLDAVTVAIALPCTQSLWAYPPSNSATSLQPPSLLTKTLKKPATSPQQLRNIATPQHRNKQASLPAASFQRNPGLKTRMHRNPGVFNLQFHDSE